MLRYFENFKVRFSGEGFPSVILEKHNEIYLKLQGALPQQLGIWMSLKCVLGVE